MPRGEGTTFLWLALLLPSHPLSKSRTWSDVGEHTFPTNCPPSTISPSPSSAKNRTTNLIKERR
uniref:Expressed protein n=1 Tax=Echinococcus granulosus TaxID=6210 RepID=A0A068WRV1_ECHGR|nr:expressed protein [Echinococcus granulosus]